MSSVGSASSGLDSLLLSYYQAQINSSPSAIAAASATSSTSSTSATANDDPPWDNAQPSQVAEQAKVLDTTEFLNTSNIPLTAGATSDTKTEQDNQKLFSIYNAVSSLSELAQMAQSSSETSGQLAGLNTRFQSGLTQIENYIGSTSFNNFTLQSATPSSSVTSTASVSLGTGNYTTQQFLDNAEIDNPVSGLSTSDSFTISVTKDGTTTQVPIDLSQMQGSLTLGNIVTYINSQLSTDGFSTRFQINTEGGTTTSDSSATYGLQITPGGDETVSLSADSTPALYMVGDSGDANEVDTVTGTGTNAQTETTPADETGRLTKIGNLSSNPTTILSSDQDAATGVTSAQATVVDSSGNVYVLGNATGNLSNSEINQGSQDVYLTKYDSAGNVVWQQLVGSTGTASAYGMALDPAGGVVITGTSTSDLTSTSVGDGNDDSFVASYDASGNQNWMQQIASGESTGSFIALDPNGASVLDALGLPSGTVNPNQTVTLANQTTLRAGGSFQIKIEGVASRTATITIQPGETYDSLVTQINGELGSTGKASIDYTSGGAESLTITASKGQTLDLISGPTDSDALGRLGISAGVISGATSSTDSSSTSPTTSSSSDSSSSSSSSSDPTYGLGLTGSLLGTGSSMNISTKTGADLARSQLLTVLSDIQSIYQKTNTPPSSSTTTGNTTGTASAQTTAQLANYGTALSLLGTSSSDALNNIATLVAGGSIGNTSSTSSSSDDSSDNSLLSLFT